MHALTEKSVPAATDCSIRIMLRTADPGESFSADRNTFFYFYRRIHYEKQKGLYPC